MLRFGPEDTYSEGSFTLDQDSYIICPPEMKKEVRMKNPNIKIIEYKNISLDEATEILIFYLGYKNKAVSNDKWCGDSKDNDTFFEICKENDLKDQDIVHFDSKQMMRSQLFEKTHQILSIFNLVRENNIILDESDYENIFKKSKRGPFWYRFSSREEIVQVFFMFSKNLINLLESQGFSISIDEQKELEKMINKVVDGISLYNCNLTGRLNEISSLIIESYMYSLQIRNGAYDKLLETMEENVENKKR